jgi:cell division protein ZapE
MTPIAAALRDGHFEPDPAQAAAAAELTRLHRELLAWQAPTPSLANRLLLRRRRATAIEPVRGLYLWGEVGRGKTWLMDLFFDALPFAKSIGCTFIVSCRGCMPDMARMKGRPNPLREVAKEIAERCRVLCLDEMQVNDITDAMIMGGLLEGLFEHGVTLVTTSNIAPDGLYRSGIQRDRFTPAIALMQRHCTVLELSSPTDYRLRRLEQASVYLTPLDDRTDAALADYFMDITAPEHRRWDAIIVNDRDIPTVGWGDGVVWLDFDVICQIPAIKAGLCRAGASVPYAAAVEPALPRRRAEQYRPPADHADRRGLRLQCQVDGERGGVAAATLSRPRPGLRIPAHRQPAHRDAIARLSRQTTPRLKRSSEASEAIAHRLRDSSCTPITTVTKQIHFAFNADDLGVCSGSK